MFVTQLILSFMWSQLSLTHYSLDSSFITETNQSNQYIYIYIYIIHIYNYVILYILHIVLSILYILYIFIKYEYIFYVKKTYI